MKIRKKRKLFKNSKYSYAVSISPDIVRALKLKAGQKIIVTADTRTGKIVIEDWKPKAKKK
ncbi:hypothetical protein HQ544_03375 [Candidatus Falkowbacteria bacterium]|nr:hypothetical protein [Candidatus Falkowbacteria bacterium]